jgi:hypothetical protein
MVGKGKSIAHTSESINYGWNQEKEAKVVFRQHLAGENPNEISNEFKIIQSMNENCKKNTLSFVLSPTIEDGRKLKRKDLNQICSEFINEMKLMEHQAIAFAHFDKSHLHLHLYANRVDFEGKAYPDSYIGKKSQRIAAIVAKSLGLTTVREIQEKKLLATKHIRKEIKSIHEKVLKSEQPKNFDEYLDKMSLNSVKVIPSINKRNQVQGFRFEYKGHNFKGSEINRATMSGSKITTALLENRAKSKGVETSHLKQNKDEKNRRSSGYSH